MRYRQAFALTLTLIICVTDVAAQGSDSVYQAFPVDRYIESVAKSSTRLEKRLSRAEAKSVKRFQRFERKMYNRLVRIDSLKANKIFKNEKPFASADLKESMRSYIPALDSMATSLKYLKVEPSGILDDVAKNDKLDAAIDNVKLLGDRIEKADGLRLIMRKRQEYLKRQLADIGFVREIRALQKETYYYSEKIKEIKSLLKSRERIQRKALELLGKSNAFQQFMRRNSMLSALFRMPVDPNDPGSVQVSTVGLQSRSQVNNILQQQLASGGSNAQQQMQQNMQAAQREVNQLKDKLMKQGLGDSDDIIPDGFRPNPYKTKSFLQRLEFGANIQSQKATTMFPVSSDIGFSVGYKINDRSVIGVGGSYKIGWGRSIRQINITHQGLGLRSFLDWRIKGSFWLSGGYEMNYRLYVNSIQQMKDKHGWQNSGLVGLSKVISLNSKVFKKTKMQILWDFLSHNQFPNGSPLTFRIGYTF